MVNVTELRPGNYFIDEGNLYQVLDILLNKTAMRKMVAKVKVKNVRTGTINELARNSGYMLGPQYCLMYLPSIVAMFGPQYCLM